jgi:protein-arginine kinase activator protein McsA
MFKNITKIDKKRMIKEAKKERLIAKKHFENAGSLFEQIRMLKHAASCFYTGRNFAKAA